MDQPNVLEEFLERVRSLLGPNPPALSPAEVEAILELARVAAHTADAGRPGYPSLAGLVLGGSPRGPDRSGRPGCQAVSPA